MVEARDGAIWFGTGGVARFDGVTWTTFITDPGLPYGQVTSILEDRAGHIWTSSPFGVGRYDGTAWTTYTTRDGLPDDRVWAAVIDSAGVLWFGTSAGVSRFDGTAWSTPLAGFDINALVVDRQNHLWAGTYGTGAFRFDGETWTQFTSASTGGGLGDDTVWALGAGRDTAIWMATDHSGLSRLKDGSWTTYTTADGLASHLIWKMLVDRAGAVWFGTDVGVSRFDGAGWRTYGPTDGLGDAQVFSLLEDSAGALWFGVGSQGIVNRFDRSTWRIFTTADGLGGNSASMLEDHLGALWFSTVGGVTRWDGTTWITYTTADGLLQDHAGPVFEDRDGVLWAGYGFQRPGLSRFDGTAWSTFPTDTTLARWGTWRIFQDRTGNFWFATVGGGVVRYDGRTWTNFTSASTGGGLGDDTVFGIAEDRAGNLWFATAGYAGGGVTRYDGGAWTNFTDPTHFATDVLADRNGNIWVLTAGVAMFDGTSWTLHNPQNGFPAEYNLGGVVEDRDGGIWVGTPVGAARFDGTSWTTFTADQGLPSNFVGPTLEDRSGAVWFSSLVGIARYERDRVPPLTRFVSRPQRLSPVRDHAANFVSAFRDIVDISYSFRLDGGPWSPWSPFGSWSQRDLADGPHVLETRSRDFEGNVYPLPAAAPFEVDATPPFAEIASPAFGQAVRGTVEIRGTATDARLGEYRVVSRPAGSPSWDPPHGTLIHRQPTPAAAAPLASWDTASLPDGNYDLRLAVTDTLGLVGTAQVTVIVDNHAPFADVTAPARVAAATGGDIHTTNSELHLYFPPRGFREDAVVTVSATSPDSVPAALPSGARRALAGYDVDWGEVALEKPARLAVSYAGVDPAVMVGTLALYHSADGTIWRRLGGTVDEGTRRISLAVSEPGRYALFAGGTEPSGGRTLSSLSFTPRVFSPSGGFADREVGIGFVLGQASSVTVRVYSRAGWLVREVVSGQAMDPGSNLVRWDGRDGSGAVVTDGLYLVTVEALGQTRSQTLAVVR